MTDEPLGFGVRSSEHSQRSLEGSHEPRIRSTELTGIGSSVREGEVIFPAVAGIFDDLHLVAQDIDARIGRG